MWILDRLKLLKNSDTMAVIERTGRYTFKELWEHSEQIAKEIINTKKNTPVVIYGDKDPNILPVMMATLKTGRAYVPVDVSYPLERLNVISDLIDACCIFNFSDKTIDNQYSVIEKSFLNDVIYKTEIKEDIEAKNWVGDNDNCYILFTSGSTGKPKGVPITKSNLVNFESWFSSCIRPDCLGQNVLNQASYSFDASVEMLYVFLAAGKTLVCVDKGLNENIGELVDWIKQNEIAIWSSTSSFLDICSKNPLFNGEYLDSLETIIVGGEVFSKNTAGFLFKYFPKVNIYNTYGPTEATVEITCCKVTKEMVDNPVKTIPIGEVLPEAYWYLENENGEKCPDGVIGELVVFSKSVSKGYLNEPEKNAKVFIKAEDGRMGYKTGDLVYSEGGVLYFVGRKDFQVKINGYM